MITLNQIAYNVQNMMYPKSLLDPQREGQIALRQIKFWIHYHRAKLIAENVSKGILNSTSLYQAVEHADYTFPIKKLSYRDNNINAYGINSPSTQDRGDWRNLGDITLRIPEIVSLHNNSAIKRVTAERRVHDVANDQDSAGSAKIPIYAKSESEASFGDFNKFTSNNKPYYLIVKKLEKGDTINNGGIVLRVFGLQISPNNLGDIDAGLAVNSSTFSNSNAETLTFEYLISYNAILQDPTQLNSNEIDVNSSLLFDDETSPYPIPAEYVKDLIERVLQAEGSVSLKTLQSEL